MLQDNWLSRLPLQARRQPGKENRQIDPKDLSLKGRFAD
jgi:hypothetical protein